MIKVCIFSGLLYAPSVGERIRKGDILMLPKKMKVSTPPR